MSASERIQRFEPLFENGGGRLLERLNAVLDVSWL